MPLYGSVPLRKQTVAVAHFGPTSPKAKERISTKEHISDFTVVVVERAGRLNIF